MKKMQYPKNTKMLLVRDCIVAICNENEPASKLLSVLLYWYDHSKDDAQDGDFYLRRTQAELANDACNLIDIKTIHDTAVPLLQLLGYLDVKEQMGGNCYVLHIDRINAGLAAFEKGSSALHSFLKSACQLESALIEITEEELESALINKKRLYFELERVRIAIRNGSNCKRGRKAGSQAASKAKTGGTEITKRLLENNTIETTSSSATATPKAGSKKEKKVISLSSRKNSKKKPQLVIPTGPIEKPDLAQALSEEAILAIGDYIRKCRLRDKRDIEKAHNAALSFLEAGYSLQDIYDIALMLSARDDIRAEENRAWLKDMGYVGNYSADLWNLPNKMASKLQLREKLRAEYERGNKAPATTSKQSTQGSLFEQPAESSAPEPEQKDAGPDLVYWTLDGKITSHNWLTWGWMPFEEAQKLGLKFKSTFPSLKRDTIQSKKATACSELGLLDEFLKLSKEEQWKPLVDWVKQFQVTTETA